MKKIILPTVLFTLACAAQAATIMVDSPDDSLVATTVGTNCTLRGAVDSINNGGDNHGCTSSGTYGTNDTIKFDTDLTTINVHSSEIEITENLTITGRVDGSGHPAITLNGDGNNRILHATGNTSTVFSLTITDVKFTNGNAANDEGGAIRLVNALYDPYDPASPSPLLKLENCAFDNNKAKSSGGAVMAYGSVSISNSTFTLNTTNGDDGGTGGGAIRVEEGGAIISNSTFTQNIAAGSFFNHGGAVYAIRYQSAGVTAAISNSTFDGNTASTFGGAVYAAGTSSYTVISNSTFSGNTSGRSGGAVYAEGTSSYAAISNSTFSGNTSEGSSSNTGGGAVYAIRTNTNISNSTFFSNKASNHGGAVHITSNSFNSSGTLTAHHLTLLNNSADGNGQALYLGGSNGDNAISLHNSIIIGNNGSDQCINSSDTGTIAGSYNLEGWAVDATDSLPDTYTCNTANPVSGNGMALNTIINSTLDDNGSAPTVPLTQTLALPPTSPAIEAADPNGSEMLKIALSQSPPWDWEDATEDQRGYGRAANSDERSIGAYESGGTPPPPPTPPSGSGTPIPALPVPLLLALAALVGTAAAARQRRR